MRKIISVLILFVGINAFSQKIPSVMKTEFPATALQDSVVDLEGNSATIEKVFSNYKGKIVLLDLWATWCGDCIKNMPALKSLHEKNPDVTFVLSLIHI